jgi:phosphatidylserine/phosphatidylglycerophosphate/cardiolipin synthase-like enzyme
VIFGKSYGHNPSYALKPAAVTNLLIFAMGSKDEQSFRVDAITAGGVGTGPVPAANEATPATPTAGAGGGAKTALAGPKPAAAQDGVSVFFSPGGNCLAAVVAQIGSARKSVHVQSYVLTAAPIATALTDAKKRGVEVIVVLDKKQGSDRSSLGPALKAAGVPVLIDARQAAAHNTIVLIDGRVIITGSFTFAREADTDNADNLVIIQDKPDLAAAYEKSFQDHLRHAGPLTATP